MYTLIYTSLPIIIYGIWDQDVTKDVSKHPHPSKFHPINMHPHHQHALFLLPANPTLPSWHTSRRSQEAASQPLLYSSGIARVRFTVKGALRDVIQPPCGRSTSLLDVKHLFWMSLSLNRKATRLQSHPEIISFIWGHHLI